MLRLRPLHQRRSGCLVRRTLPVGRTVLGENAHAARGFARVADTPPVEDDPMREVRPLLAFDELAHSMLDLHRVGLLRPSPAPDETAEMGVDGDPGNPERVAEHHIRGLTAETGQRDKFLQGARHLAVETFDERLPQPDDRVRLVPVEARRPDHLLEFGAVGLRVGAGRGITGEERGRHLVDADVGALRGQDRGDREFQRSGEVEFAIDMRKRDLQGPVHPAGTADETQMGFGCAAPRAARCARRRRGCRRRRRTRAHTARVVITTM